MDPIQFARGAYERARRARSDAHALHHGGFHSAAVVWAVRATEILMRDFLLATYYIEQGVPFAEALRRGSDVLWSNRWRDAFAQVEEWYGPFDQPLTDDGQDAWTVWREVYVERRPKLVHGNAVEEADRDEAAAVLRFADQIADWYSMRLFVAGKHPMAHDLRNAFEGARNLLIQGRSDVAEEGGVSPPAGTHDHD